MALQRDAKYSGRYDAATPAQPQGAFKNRTSPTSQDGSYMEKDWLNDWSGFMSSLLEANGITPNGLVDEVGASQYFQGMLRLRQVEPLNNDWNGFFDPKHQAQLPSPAGYPATIGAGGTVYGTDDEWSFGNYSSGAANTISADDDGVIFSVGMYKLFTFTIEQLALIDVNKVSVYIVDETGKHHFPSNATNGVNVTKPDATTLKVELTNAIFTTLSITKVWRFFVTEGVGWVAESSPNEVERIIRGGYILIENSAGIAHIYKDGYIEQWGVINNPTLNANTLFNIVVPVTDLSKSEVFGQEYNVSQPSSPVSVIDIASNTQCTYLLDGFTTVGKLKWHIKGY